MKKNKKNKSKKKNSNLAIVVCFVIFFVLLGFILLKMGLNKTMKILEEPKPLYSYNITRNTDYNVKLIPNPYYEDTYLPSGKNYPAFAVESFSTAFIYDFKSSIKSNYTYTYDITAEIVGKALNNSSTEKEIWNKKFVILGSRTKTEENINAFSIKENVDINYDYYNSLVREYEIACGFSIDATLKVRLKISYDMNLSNLKLDNEYITDYVEIDIPLSDKVTTVEENYEKSTLNEVLPKTDIKEESQYKISYLIGSLVSLVIAVIIPIVYANKRTISKEKNYHKNINHILKEYSDLIVTITNKPNLTGLKMMRPSVFSDLVDVAEQSHSNIIHYETLKNKESELYVLTDRYYYIFNVTSDELKEK